MEIKDRIMQFVDSKGFSINYFEKSIGVSKSYFNNTKNISAKVISEIVRVYSEISSQVPINHSKQPAVVHIRKIVGCFYKFVYVTSIYHPVIPFTYLHTLPFGASSSSK